MAKKHPANAGSSWTGQETKLNQLLRQNTPTRLIAYKLGRSPAAVQTHVNRSGKSTKPVNQSPYGSKSK